MKSKRTLFVVKAGVIAAVYVVLTLISTMFGLSSGVIQVRISEALSFLPFITGSAVPGLTVGCLISNMLSGGVPQDIILGTVATFLGALGARIIGKTAKNHRNTAIYLSTLPNVVFNTLIIPWVLKLAYGAEQAVWLMMITVGIGEFIACVLLGSIVITAFKSKFRLLKD